MKTISRRKLITGGLAATAGAGGLAVAARLAKRYGLIPPDGTGIYGPGETLTYASQRLLTRHSLAREFSRSMISKTPYSNTTKIPLDAFTMPLADAYSQWKLTIDGMVAHPTTLTLADIKAFPVRSQITEVACEEGWSYIGEWIGVPLHQILTAVGILPQARFVAYFSNQQRWWDSVDMGDALHPQTLVTYAMNDAELPLAFGGPLRIRVPRQIGYKSVKWLTHITVTDSMKNFGNGRGSARPYGPDGYAWYAGI